MDVTVSSPTRRWPIQKRSQDRLERVLRVAEELIVERGFANLNMKELAEIAKVNISTIYTYFPNGQSLLRVLAMRILAELQNRMVPLFSEIDRFDSPEKILDGYMDLVFDFYHRHPTFHAIWRGMQSDRELMMMDIEDSRLSAQAIVPLLKAINPKLSDDVETTAIILVSINGAVIRLASELGVREREVAHHQLRLLVRRMLIF